MAYINEVIPRLSTLEASPTLLIACVIPIALYIFQRKSLGASRVQNPRGCRKLGILKGSNLADEHDERYGQRVEPGKGQDGMPSWRVKALAAYPIKSCKAVELDTAHVVGTGIEYDRHFCFAEYLTPTSVKVGATEAESAPRWVFRTLREGKYNRLTHIQPEIWVVDYESPTYSPDLEEVSWGGVLLVRYPKLKPEGLFGLMTSLGSVFGLYSREGYFKVPLNVSEKQDYPRRTVRIFKDFPVGIDLGVHLPDDFRKFIGAQNPLTLFRADSTRYREVFRCAPRKAEVGFQPAIGFADTYPLHLLGLASVQDLGKRTASSLPQLTIRRFRPNIVIQGPGPYEEDMWKRIRINQNEIAAAARTTRCRLPNVDPDSGERHDSEPDKTMRSFRCIDEGDPKKACLGMQMVPLSRDFTLSVGDELEVLETGEHSWT